MSVKGKIKKWFLQRMAPKESAEKMAIDYITTLGTLGDRLEALEDIEGKGEDGLIEWTASTFRAMLPYMNIKGDTDMFERMTAFLNIHDYYETVKTWENNGGNKNSKITRLITYLKQELTFLSKVMLGLSFGKIDEYRTIVLNKPYILEAGSRKIIETGGGSTETE